MPIARIVVAETDALSWVSGSGPCPSRGLIFQPRVPHDGWEANVSLHSGLVINPVLLVALLVNSCFTVRIITPWIFDGDLVFKVLGPVRQRSTRCRSLANPGNRFWGKLSSMTSELPSQYPRESPPLTDIGRQMQTPFMTMLRCHPCPWPTS